MAMKPHSSIPPQRAMARLWKSCLAQIEGLGEPDHRPMASPRDLMVVIVS